MSHLTVWSNYVTIFWLPSKLKYIEQEIQSLTYIGNTHAQISHIKFIFCMQYQLTLALFDLIFL
jgi:hypothetical protein